MIGAGEPGRSRMKIGGPEWMTETTTEDQGRSTRTDGKEDEMEGFHVEVEVEGLVEDGE